MKKLKKKISISPAHWAHCEAASIALTGSSNISGYIAMLIEKDKNTFK